MSASTPGDEAAIIDKALYAALVLATGYGKTETAKTFDEAREALVRLAEKLRDANSSAWTSELELAAAQRERDARRERLVALQECEERERALVADCGEPWFEWRRRALAAEAQVESLRAALQQIADAHPTFSDRRLLQHVARDALRVDRFAPHGGGAAGRYARAVLDRLVAALTATESDLRATEAGLIASSDRVNELNYALTAAQRERDDNKMWAEVHGAKAVAAEAQVESLRAALERIARMPVAQGPGVRMREIARAALRVDPAEGES